MDDRTNGDSPTEACPPTMVELNAFRRAMNMVVGRWKMDILWVLIGGPMRFGECLIPGEDVGGHPESGDVTDVPRAVRVRPRDGDQDFLGAHVVGRPATPVTQRASARRPAGRAVPPAPKRPIPLRKRPPRSRSPRASPSSQRSTR